MAAAIELVTEFATSADGTRIAFDRLGTGPVLVLVDGALCSRAFGPARALQRAMGAHFTTIAWDRRGRGESGDAPHSGPEREIDDLRAVIVAAGGDAVVFGQSSGAALVYRAAAAGVPMRRLAGFEAPWVGRKPGEDYLGTLDGLLDRDERGKAVGYFLTTMVGGPAFLPVMLRLMRGPWKAMRSVAPTLRYDARIMGADFSVPADELARIAVPSLVMAGGKSPVRMATAQEAVAAAIPGARYRVLEGQTHQVSEKALLPVLTEFFGE